VYFVAVNSEVIKRKIELKQSFHLCRCRCVCVSGCGAQFICELHPSSEARRNQSVRHGVRRTSRCHRLLSGSHSWRTCLPESTDVHHDNNCSRLLHEPRPGQWTWFEIVLLTIHNFIRYDTIVEFNVDSKAECSSTRSQKKKLK